MISPKFNAKDFTIKLKATIQRSGKLGFTSDTIKKLGLEQGFSIYLAKDDENKKVMYMGIVREVREDAFPLLSSGKYPYLNTTGLFKELKFDFVNKVYIFDLSRYPEGDEAMESECYKMDLRWKERSKDDNEIDPEA